MKTAVVAALGDPGSGKSCLLDSLSYASIDWLTGAGLPRQGVRTSLSAEWENDQGQLWDLELVDSSGAADPLSALDGAAVALLVYDMCSAEAVQRLGSVWAPLLQGLQIPLVLVAAKHDQWTEERQQLGHVQSTVEQGRHMSARLRASGFIVTSGATRYGVSSETPDLLGSPEGGTLPRAVMELCEGAPESTAVLLEPKPAPRPEGLNRAQAGWGWETGQALEAVLSQKQQARCTELFSSVPPERPGEGPEEYESDLAEALGLYWEGLPESQPVELEGWLRFWGHLKLSMGDARFARWLKSVSEDYEQHRTGPGPIQVPRKGWFSSRASSRASTPRRSPRPGKPAPKQRSAAGWFQQGRADGAGFERPEEAFPTENWIPAMQGFAKTAEPAPLGRILSSMGRHAHFDLSHPDFQSREPPPQPPEPPEPLGGSSECRAAVQQAQSTVGLDAWLRSERAPAPPQPVRAASEAAHPVAQVRRSYSELGPSEQRFQRMLFGGPLPKKAREPELSQTFGTEEAEAFTRQHMGERAGAGNLTFKWLEQEVTPGLRKLSKAAAARAQGVARGNRAAVAALDLAGQAEQLCLASARGDLVAVQSLLDAKADPETRDSTGAPVLWTAAYLQREAVLEALLAAGANPRSLDARGEDAIQVAVRVGRPDVAARLQAVRILAAPVALYTDARVQAAERNLDTLLAGSGLRVMPTAQLMQAAYVDSFQDAVLHTDMHSGTFSTHQWDSKRVISGSLQPGN